NSTITNSLLFIDLIAFKRYLEGERNVREIAQRLEYITINITYHTLSSKKKNRADEKLEQLFASSLTFIESRKKHFDGAYRNELRPHSINENKYYLDVACLTAWEDHSLDYTESE